MKAIFIMVLSSVFGQLYAIDVNIDCLYGIINAETCCKEVLESEDILLRNPADCKTYFQCVHQKPIVRDCPSGLHWSVSANRCDWPHLAGCGNPPAETHPEGCLTGELSAENCCKGVPYWVDVLLPNPDDCNSYIQCVHEKPVIRQCPAGLHWSIVTRRCEWPDIAQCKQTTTTSRPESPSTTSTKDKTSATASRPESPSTLTTVSKPPTAPPVETSKPQNPSTATITEITITTQGSVTTVTTEYPTTSESSSHESGSHEHGSHEHGSHESGSNEHGSHESGSHNHGSHEHKPGHGSHESGSQEHGSHE